MAKNKTSITSAGKDEISRLQRTKVLRKYGIGDLKRYIEKLNKNIEVFEEAINKERAEIKKTRDMINVLENDIKEASTLEKKIKDKII